MEEQLVTCILVIIELCDISMNLGLRECDRGKGERIILYQC